MTNCDYCGRENRGDARFCDECGTELHKPQMPRHLTTRDRKQGWVAVAVAVVCAVAGSALIWRTSETLSTVGGGVATIGFVWAVLTLVELRKRKANTEDNSRGNAEPLLSPGGQQPK